MQAQCRARERSPSTDNGGHEPHTEETSNTEQHGHNKEANVEADKMNAENNLNSYAGRDDAEKMRNRIWFHDVYKMHGLLKSWTWRT